MAPDLHNGSTMRPHPVRSLQGISSTAPCVAGLVMLGCATPDGEGAVELGNIEKADGAGVVLELGDDRERHMFFECSQDEGCDIELSADLARPDPCDLLPEACDDGRQEPARLVIATLEVETPAGDQYTRDIAVSRGPDGELRAGVEDGEFLDQGPGVVVLSIARAPAIDVDLDLRFEASWRDSGGGEDGDDDGAAVGDNLLPNAGFDQGEAGEGCPPGWSCVTYPDGAGTFATDEDSSGERSATWTGDNVAASAIIQQIHPAAPGDAFRVSASGGGENLAEPPYVQILFQGEDGDILAHDRFTAAEHGGGFSGVTGTSRAAPSGTSEVRFNLSVEDTTGAVWWNDASLVEAEPSGGGEPADGIHLCDEGLSDGDLINPHLEEHVASGETVIVCRGDYELSSISLSADDWTLIAPEGATLRVPAGQNTLLTTEGDDYRVAGFIFDQTASGSSLSFNPAGDDWQVDHLAWRGEHPGGSRLMAPSVDSQGAEGTIDRVYMGDGQVEGTGSGAVWVNANRGHFGDLTFSRVYMAHFIDNALYATGVPTNGQPGRTHIEDSFFWSSTIANARTGSLSGPCFIRGSVFVLDDTTQACGTGCSNPGARTTRAVWSWYGEVVVEDSDFTIEHGARTATTNGGTVTESENRTGAEASTEPPADVPTSPESIYEDGPGTP